MKWDYKYDKDSLVVDALCVEAFWKR